MKETIKTTLHFFNNSEPKTVLIERQVFDTPTFIGRVKGTDESTVLLDISHKGNSFTGCVLATDAPMYRERIGLGNDEPLNIFDEIVEEYMKNCFKKCKIRKKKIINLENIIHELD